MGGRQDEPRLWGSREQFRESWTWAGFGVRSGGRLVKKAGQSTGALSLTEERRVCSIKGT